MRVISRRLLATGLMSLLPALCLPRLQAQTAPPAPVRVALWLTNPDGSALFKRQDPDLSFTSAADRAPTIIVDEGQRYQTMDGFGCALTGGSAMLIHRMNPDKRAILLKELFSTRGDSIGISYLRISIGASDLSDHVFSYDDLPAGQTDTGMEHFSLEPEQKDLIPLLQQILAINPEIKILGSPWSPPGWMKTNGKSKGGSLKPEFYGAYAKYFVEYIQGMKAEGIRLDAITIQNEPLNPGNNPSLMMSAAEQGAFIKSSLGPAFRAAGIDTRIILYDHNADRPDYPISILNDPEARQYVDGTAFHLYGGKIEALSAVHDAHPDKNLYFTEQWVGAPGNLSRDLSWHLRMLIIGATRNWSRNVLEWNLAADPNQNPHTEGGCTSCLGALTIGDEITRNPAYYIMAHASKFVRPGSVRIASNMPEGLPNVAFKAPGGGKVLIVLNDGPEIQVFTIRWAGRVLTTHLNKGAVGTYVW
jgi:glucosylceramidase